MYFISSQYMLASKHQRTLYKSQLFYKWATVNWRHRKQEVSFHVLQKKEPLFLSHDFNFLWDSPVWDLKESQQYVNMSNVQMLFIIKGFLNKRFQKLDLFVKCCGTYNARQTISKAVYSDTSCDTHWNFICFMLILYPGIASGQLEDVIGPMSQPFLAVDMDNELEVTYVSSVSIFPLVRKIVTHCITILSTICCMWELPYVLLVKLSESWNTLSRRFHLERPPSPHIWKVWILTLSIASYNSHTTLALSQITEHFKMLSVSWISFYQ